MSWIDKIKRAFTGNQEGKSQENVILSNSSKTDPARRVKPKQEAVLPTTTTKPNILAKSSKTDTSPASLARPNNPEMQARIDKRTRVIEH